MKLQTNVFKPITYRVIGFISPAVVSSKCLDTGKHAGTPMPCEVSWYEWHIDSLASQWCFVWESDIDLETDFTPKEIIDTLVWYNMVTLGKGMISSKDLCPRSSESMTYLHDQDHRSLEERMQITMIRDISPKQPLYQTEEASQDRDNIWRQNFVLWSHPSLSLSLPLSPASGASLWRMESSVCPIHFILMYLIQMQVIKFALLPHCLLLICLVIKQQKNPESFGHFPLFPTLILFIFVGQRII